MVQRGGCTSRRRLAAAAHPPLQCKRNGCYSWVCTLDIRRPRAAQPAQRNATHSAMPLLRVDRFHNTTRFARLSGSMKMAAGNRSPTWGQRLPCGMPRTDWGEQLQHVYLCVVVSLINTQQSNCHSLPLFKTGFDVFTPLQPPFRTGWYNRQNGVWVEFSSRFFCLMHNCTHRQHAAESGTHASA